MSIYNASKAAPVSFFETLRVELGPDIKITIVTPGFIESEMTKDKFLYKEDNMEVDQDLRVAQFGTIPVETARGCATAIVKSACRGDRYLTEPAWFKVTYFWKVFCPEVVEWTFRFLSVTSPGTSHKETMGKKILDFTGAKKFLYPSGIQTTEIETD